MDTIREFIVSSSGLAPARQGLSLGWLIVALSAVSVLFGSKKAEAQGCPDTWTECENNHAGCLERGYPMRCCTYESDRYCDIVSTSCVCG